ncbi:unnamed protein product [Cladocopium goreaui]|uniref:Uncharacterized protein n=1 Tax=Cladocopium goreaui TaxID=2562237 RepID=A0A9P1C6M6_9DINO|nr:unnamed protein product [Cladocopium goreaui]
MRIARAPTKLQTERFGTSISVLPTPRTVRPRAADSNDSGSVWQVVFRQVEPIDPARPFLPVCEDLSQQASSPRRHTQDAAVHALRSTREEDNREEKHLRDLRTGWR